MLQPEALEDPLVICLKGGQCEFWHPDAKPDGHVYRKPRPKGRGKSRGRGNELWRKPIQMFMATLGQMTIATAAVAAVS